MKKIECAAVVMMVVVASNGIGRADGPTVLHPPIQGGMPNAWMAVQGELPPGTLRNRWWRNVVVSPPECVYHVRSLGRSFRYIPPCVGPSCAGTAFQGCHYELGVSVTSKVRNEWVMPAGEFYLELEPSGPNVEHFEGACGVPGMRTTTPEGVKEFFMGSILIDGEVYTTWCEIIAAKAVYSAPQLEPTPAEPLPDLPESDAPLFLPELKAPSEYSPGPEVPPPTFQRPNAAPMKADPPARKVA